MKQIALLFCCMTTLLNCQSESVTAFSPEALQDAFLQLDGKTVTFKNILDKHSGSYVFVDVWASWCKDCRKALPDVQTLQKDHPNMAYVFLSLDRSKTAWRKSIVDNNIEGDHYFMTSGWKGPMGKFLDLDWIPRYMVIDPKGKILVYRAIKTTDKTLLKHLK